MVTTAIQKHWTYTDYLYLDDEQRYEIIEGELIVTPAPSFRHQRIVTRLIQLLSNYILEKGIGEVVVAPVDVVLCEDMVVQPDIIFISNKNKENIRESGVFGAPDLVVEIISPSSLYKDIQVKKRVYEKFGIREYWIVFPDEKTVEIFSLKQGRYELVSSSQKSGKIKSIELSLEIDVRNIFRCIE